MITKQQILDAANDLGIKISHYEKADTWAVTGHKLDTLLSFAHKMYSAGLLAGAEKCDEIADKASTSPGKWRAHCCAEALREMAKEINNDH